MEVRGFVSSRLVIHTLIGWVDSRYVLNSKLRLEMTSRNTRPHLLLKAGTWFTLTKTVSCGQDNQLFYCCHDGFCLFFFYTFYEFSYP